MWSINHAAGTFLSDECFHALLVSLFLSDFYFWETPIIFPLSRNNELQTWDPLKLMIKCPITMSVSVAPNVATAQLVDSVRWLIMLQFKVRNISQTFAEFLHLLIYLIFESSWINNLPFESNRWSSKSQSNKLNWFLDLMTFSWSSVFLLLTIWTSYIVSFTEITVLGCVNRVGL